MQLARCFNAVISLARLSASSRPCAAAASFLYFQLRAKLVIFRTVENIAGVVIAQVLQLYLWLWQTSATVLACVQH